MQINKTRYRYNDRIVYSTRLPTTTTTTTATTDNQ